jgi:hypothetical protein
MIRCAILLLFATRAAVADPLVDATSSREDVVGAEAQLGLATAPFDTMAFGEAKGQAFVVTLDGSHALGAKSAIGIRVPFVIASVAQPAGSYVDDATVANPQLRGAYRWVTHGMSIVGGLDLGAPLAGHGATLMQNRALAIANAVEGLGYPDQFTPGMVSLTPFTSVQWTSLPWSVEGVLRLPLLVRVSDADMASAKDVGFVGVLDLEGRRQLTRRLALAGATRLTVEIRPAVVPVRSRSRVQDLERLGLGIRLTGRAVLNIELQAALGGELGGSTFGLGVRSVVTLP